MEKIYEKLNKLSKKPNTNLEVIQIIQEIISIYRVEIGKLQSDIEILKKTNEN